MLSLNIPGPKGKPLSLTPCPVYGVRYIVSRQRGVEISKTTEKLFKTVVVSPLTISYFMSLMLPSPFGKTSSFYSFQENFLD